VKLLIFSELSTLPLDCPDISEVNDNNIMKLINIASGTYQHTLGTITSPYSQPKPATAQRTKPEPQQASAPVVQHVSLTTGGRDTTKVQTGPGRGMGGEKQTTASTKVEGVIIFENEDAITSAIRDVKNDGSNTTWCLITYTAPKTNKLKFHASGTGNFEELRSHLTDDVVMYGIIRVVERIDDTDAVKFAFIDWRGENINRMQRASLGVHSGAVADLFRPFHVDVQCADHSEISEVIIMRKIKFGSGTAVHVK